MLQGRRIHSREDQNGDAVAAQISDGNLPPLVRRYLDRVLPSGDSVPRMVRLTQAGECA